MIQFRLEVHPCHERPEGQLDEREAKRIRNRLKLSQEYAWFDARVVAYIEGVEIEGDAWLGCCSYRNEKDFKQQDGYWPDLCKEAESDLEAKLKHLLEKAQQASVAHLHAPEYQLVSDSQHIAEVLEYLKTDPEEEYGFLFVKARWLLEHHFF